MSKTLGLALGSGGARGVAHIGFLQALDEAGIKPDYITGCSMGAVVGGCYASGMSPKEMKKIVLQLKPRDLIDVNPTALTQMSLLRSKKLRDLLASNIGDVEMENLKTPFKCVATDILSGQLHIFESGSTALAVQASSTIPCVFKPVEYRNKLLVDGGCLCRVPVRLVKDMGADVVVAVDVLKNCSERVEKPTNILNMLLRVYDIIDAHNTDEMKIKDEGLFDLWLAPEMKGMSQYVIKDLDKAYAEGYALGKENIDKIKELLA
jgi:NTE family protein